ncbi:MAG: translation initiation factor IF-2, partial [Actinomycetota bacterium]|nr:translation initiation factor IF-2 [Actinomycetota bacterium]
MAKPRVHEVAKELGLTSKEVLAHLEKIGNPVKSHSSTIDETLAARVRSELGNGAAPDSGPPAAAETPRETKTEPQQSAQPAAEEAEPAVEPEPVAVAPEAPPAEETPAIHVHRGITVQEFAEKVDRSPAEIVKVLLGLGEMVTVTQSLSDDAVLLVADELGVDVEVVDPALEEIEDQAAADDEVDDENAVARPPVVTVMGHVDHGKTSILDAIRQTNVAGGEAGGITQHIGAYRVAHDGREVTFIDTPGHEAFTAMRARGAQVTDVAILVVAADDGVMPQTLEAIDHAKAAGVPVIVAVNKIDRPEADPARVRQQLSDRGLLPEEWGGDTIFVDVSAKQRTNLDQLLEMVLLTTDVHLDLKANPSTSASGHVIEAHLDKGRGPVSTLLVKRGTLAQGDALLAGTAWGRVRAMLDEHGKQIKSAGPGQPVQVLGWQELPEAGDEFRVVDDEKTAKRISSERDQHRRAAELVAQRGATLADLLIATQEGAIAELNLVVKSDTQGSAEALAGQLDKLDQSTVRVNLVRSGVGAITENDVALAQASNAIVIGFNVVPTGQAKTQAEENGIDIRTYRVIYQAIQDIENAARGLLGPETREVT